MTEREQFAAWLKAQDSGASGFDIWQASRRAALEEAALAVRAEQLCDPTDSPDDIAYELAVRDCEAAVRTLSAGETE